MEVDGAEDGYLSYGMLQEGQVPGRAEETRRGRELRSANSQRSVSLVGENTHGREATFTIQPSLPASLY